MTQTSAMDAFFGKNTFELAAMLVGVATIALLVSNSKGTVAIIQGAGDTFNGLLRTVTLQSGYQNAYNR